MIFVPLLTELSQAYYKPVFCAMVISIWFEKSAEEVTVRAVRACILSPRAQSSVPWVTLAKRHSYESTSGSSKHRNIVSLSPNSDFLPLKRERERKNADILVSTTVVVPDVKKTTPFLNSTISYCLPYTTQTTVTFT